MKLSIVVITMNRADQLRDALQSCVNCKLPKDVEFVVVDNASTDNTKEVVEEFFSKNSYTYTYEYQPENLGVGGGRNRAFELAKGEFAYFLDDDAIIRPEDYGTFFTKPIKVFDQFPDIATITTTIIDDALDDERIPVMAKSWRRGAYNCIYMYFGGSHFLRCDVFRKKPKLYANIMYGFEELTASLYAMDNGYVHIYMPEIAMIHCPKFNKWKQKDILLKMNKELCCIQYVMKSRVYPTYVKPILWIAFKRRWYIYAANSSYKDTMEDINRIECEESRIKHSTLIKLVSQFRLSAF